MCKVLLTTCICCSKARWLVDTVKTSTLVAIPVQLCSVVVLVIVVVVVIIVVIVVVQCVVVMLDFSGLLSFVIVVVIT